MAARSPGPASSLRKVTTRVPVVPPTRRPSTVSRSSVASSAQWASSMTMARGGGPASSSSSAAATTVSRGAPDSSGGGQVAARAAGDVAHRAEGPGGQQRVARPQQQAGAADHPLREGLHQARLPDARLAGHEHHPPLARSGVRKRRLHLRERGLPLEQLHAIDPTTPGG